ncbi:hypothetical protein CCR95_14445 [Thiocystis minor]|uniref:hypothetical protein n=1 Tax=Thiocystis minor TaxID=61597 RepID=UPI0019117566|nr:hypothetical protein [Thiocystis minor]MBK5965255.1 hypothetical protein [Thiocystis minor]
MSQSQIRFWIVAGVWLTAIAVMYLHGLSGALFYDDIRPLEKLGEIDSLFSFAALDFVLGEISGPLGRPVAMFSFLLHHAGWPDNLPSLLLVNVLIHGLNGVLVYILTGQLLRMTGAASPHPHVPRILAALAALLWLMLPIHAATILIPIQRMAALSTTFVLLGVIVYLAGLQLQSRGHRRGPDLQILSLAVCLPLAVLTKENGALLPLLLLVIELTLLTHRPDIQRYRAIRLTALSFASLAIIGYLLKGLFNHPFEPFAGRDFSVIERLLSQPLILVDYLRQAFVPNWQAINPFQDHWRHVEHWTLLSPEGLALAAILAWLFAALIARRRWPWFAFGSLWFLGAHLLESTTLGLELSFLHRNYLPLVGLAILMAIGIQRLWALKQPAISVAIVLYLGFLGFSLANVVLVWGQPETAARVWFETQPASQRAAAYLAEPLWERGDSVTALDVMEQNLSVCPDCMFSRSWALALACDMGKNETVRLHFDALLAHSPRKASLSSAAKNIESFYVLLKEGRCAPGQAYNAYILLERLIETRPPHARKSEIANLWWQLSRLYMLDGETKTALEILQKSMQIN